MGCFFGAEAWPLVQRTQFTFEKHMLLIKPAIKCAFIAEPLNQPQILFFHQTPPRKGLIKSNKPDSK
jgi:hypothetical protein